MSKGSDISGDEYGAIIGLEGDILQLEDQKSYYNDKLDDINKDLEIAYSEVHHIDTNIADSMFNLINYPALLPDCVDRDSDSYKLLVDTTTQMNINVDQFTYRTIYNRDMETYNNLIETNMETIETSYTDIENSFTGCSEEEILSATETLSVLYDSISSIRDNTDQRLDTSKDVLDLKRKEQQISIAISNINTALSNFTSQDYLSGGES